MGTFSKITTSVALAFSTVTAVSIPAPADARPRGGLSLLAGFRYVAAKIQAQVLVPLVKTLQAELGEERANAIVRKALGEHYRKLGEKQWRAASVGDNMAGAFKRFALHAVDATGIVHAMLLRIQALLLPVKTLVLSGH